MREKRVKSPSGLDPERKRKRDKRRRETPGFKIYARFKKRHAPKHDGFVVQKYRTEEATRLVIRALMRDLGFERIRPKPGKKPRLKIWQFYVRKVK